MKTFTFAVFAALAVLLHQASAQDTEVEAGVNNGRRVRTMTFDDNGAQYTRQGRRSNLDANIGPDGIQVNRNGRSITDGRSADFDVNDTGANLNLRGRRANLEANAGDRNNIEYSRRVRRGETADGSGVKRASVDLDNRRVDMVGRRATARANEDELSVTKRVRRGQVADGGDTKRANVDLNTGNIDIVGRRTQVTGRLGGTGDDALRITRVGRDREERDARRQERRGAREERRGGREDRRGGRGDRGRGGRRGGRSSSSGSSEGPRGGRRPGRR